MKSNEVRTAPPNSLVLIMDESGGDIPILMNGKLISSTCSCIAVGCAAEVDNETVIAIGHSEVPGAAQQLAFDGNLLTPNRSLTVQTVSGKILLKASVSSGLTRVMVWVNHKVEPDQILISLGNPN